MSPVAGVVTTGIYCRPGCAASPRPGNVRRFELAAAAEAAGYRACLRCRPYRTSDRATFRGPELVCRGIHLILDGVLDNHCEEDLATRLGVSARHLRRLFCSHAGVTPDQLARSSRAHFARRLLDDTDLSVTDVAFASGFGSVRQFNRTMLDVFRAVPLALRARRRRTDRLIADGGLVLRMEYSSHLDWASMLAYLGARAIRGVEYVDGAVYRRTIVVDGDLGALEIRQGEPGYLLLRAHLPHWRGLIHVVQTARHIFNLDVDLEAANQLLCQDRILRPLVSAHPLARVPGTWDPFEVGVCAIIEQHVGVADASSIAARLVERHGRPALGLGELGLTHMFPPAATLATADLDGIGLAAAHMAVIHAFARMVACGALRMDRGVSLGDFIESAATIPGLDPSTTDYLALRMGETDAFPGDDLSLRRALEEVTGRPMATPEVVALAERWRPWRANAVALLRAKGQASAGDRA